MQYCKNCAMPDTRPGSIFGEDGICQACRNYGKRNTIDWEQRKQKLQQICGKYRKADGSYDCVIPVSGGKDSHRLVHIIKEEMGMNPLLITFGDAFTKTEAGKRNYRNLGNTFKCDHILFELSIDLFRRVVRLETEEYGEPLRFIEIGIYTIPTKLAIKLGIPLIVYGENAAYEYGTTVQGHYSGLDTVLNMYKKVDIDFLLKNGISKKELNVIIPPTQEELDKVKPELIFMSYFIPWSSVTNLEIAKKNGFVDLTHEWQREGCVEHFEQIDSKGYLVHLWMKYPKFGFQRVSDIVSRRVREGRTSLPEAKKLIMKYDHKLDQQALEDFINTLGYTVKEFWAIVEKYWNREIFEKVDGVWKLKNPVYKDLIDGEENE